MYSDMHWDYCHRTLRLSDLKCCKSSHSIPFTDANWSDGTAGFKWFFRAQVHFQEKLAEQQTRLMERLPQKKKRSDSEKTRPTTVDGSIPVLLSPVVWLSSRAESIRIQNWKTQEFQEVAPKPKTLVIWIDTNQHFTTLRVIDVWNKERKNQSHNMSQSHPSELRGTLRQDWPFQKAHPQCQDLLPHQPKKLPQQHPRDRSRASRWNLK